MGDRHLLKFLRYLFFWVGAAACAGSPFPYLDQLRSLEPVAVSPSKEWMVLKEKGWDGFRLKLVNLSSTHAGPEIFSKQNPLALSWSPDSHRLAWLAKTESGCDYALHVMTVSNGTITRLEVPPTQTAWPSLAWSPDNERLAYFSGSNSAGSVIVYAFPTATQPASLQSYPSIDPLSQFIWINKSQWIAVTATVPQALVKFNLSGRLEEKLPLAQGTSLRYLAANEQNHTLLFTQRLPHREYYELFEWNWQSRATRRLASFKGDILHPKWFPDRKGYAFEVDSQGLRKLFYQDGKAKSALSLGLQPARNELLELVGDDLFYNQTSLIQPVRLQRWNRRTQKEKTLFKAKASFGVAPQSKPLPSDEGEKIPAWLWSPPRTEKKLVLWIHGGPNLNFSPIWDRKIQVLVASGVDVLALNYRGSSGYGRAFEAYWTPESLKDDIGYAVRYAIESLKVSPANIFLIAESIAFSPTLNFVAAHPNDWGGLFLLSGVVTATESASLPLLGKVIVGFHGEKDCDHPAQAARAALLTRLNKSLGGSSLNWRNLAGEGHGFAQPTSWASIWKQLLDSLSKENIPPDQKT